MNETTDTFTSRTHSAHYEFVIMKLHVLGSQIIGKLHTIRIRLVSISLSLFSLLNSKIISEIGVNKSEKEILNCVGYLQPHINTIHAKTGLQVYSLRDIFFIQLKRLNRLIFTWNDK
jgi:hypothetical protein